MSASGADLHVVYRTAGVEKRTSRPSFYSKQLCATSLVRSFEQVDRASLTVISDGERSAAVPILELLTQDVLTTKQRGNSASYLRAIETALERWPDSDWVYFVEDDYLHTEDALACLAESTTSFPDSISYASLYEHPGSYAAGRRRVLHTSTWWMRITGARSRRRA
jgi:hypothetical protein